MTETFARLLVDVWASYRENNIKVLGLPDSTARRLSALLLSFILMHQPSEEDSSHPYSSRHSCAKSAEHLISRVQERLGALP